MPTLWRMRRSWLSMAWELEVGELIFSTCVMGLNNTGLKYTSSLAVVMPMDHEAETQQHDLGSRHTPYDSQDWQMLNEISSLI